MNGEILSLDTAKELSNLRVANENLEKRNDKLQRTVEQVYCYIEDRCIIKDDDGTIHSIADSANMICIMEMLKQVR